MCDALCVWVGGGWLLCNYMEILVAWPHSYTAVLLVVSTKKNDNCTSNTFYVASGYLKMALY